LFLPLSPWLLFAALFVSPLLQSRPILSPSGGASKKNKVVGQRFGLLWPNWKELEEDDRRRTQGGHCALSWLQELAAGGLGGVTGQSQAKPKFASKKKPPKQKSQREQAFDMNPRSL
jgi:hypothetical protein